MRNIEAASQIFSCAYLSPRGHSFGCDENAVQLGSLCFSFSGRIGMYLPMHDTSD